MDIIQRMFWYIAVFMLLLNAALGAYIFKWAWGKTKIVRTPDWKRDQYIFSMCRHDAKRWDRFWLTFGAITVLIPRLLGIVVNTAVTRFFIAVFEFGMVLEEGKFYTGWRREAIQKTVMIGAQVNRLILGMRLKITEIQESEIDYSFYLGPNYKSTYKPPPGRVPTIICPHVSANDIPMLMKAFGGDMSFVAGDFMLNIPLYGKICQAIGCIFVPRSGSKDQLDQTLQRVTSRQNAVYEKGELPPVAIFPEGTCSNNRYLLRFRKGAFSTLQPVIPCTLKYSYGMVSPAIESLDEATCTIFLACSWSLIDVELKVLPVMYPNSYLYERHSDKAQEKWEIYAWACRDLMAKVGGFGRHDIPFKAKQQAWLYLAGKSDTYKLSPEEEQELLNKTVPSPMADDRQTISPTKVTPAPVSEFNMLKEEAKLEEQPQDIQTKKDQ